VRDLVLSHSKVVEKPMRLEDVGIGEWDAAAVLFCGGIVSKQLRNEAGRMRKTTGGAAAPHLEADLECSSCSNREL
jgi:hypothetical protein